MKKPVALFWFRRDLRLEDNHGLSEALKGKIPVLPVFIFDRNILDRLEDKSDSRVTFIYNALESLHQKLNQHGSALHIKYGLPNDCWKEFLNEYDVQSVYCNHDYEPYAIERDNHIRKLLSDNNVSFNTYKDQVIFEKSEIIKVDGKPYTVFTPYSNKWKTIFNQNKLIHFPSEKLLNNFYKSINSFPPLSKIGFKNSSITIPSPEINKEIITHYEESRDFPAERGTSRLGIHLRFGTISIRKLVEVASKYNDTFLKELIWREFYQSILWHFPHVVNGAFKPIYNAIPWRNDESEFALWCNGQTGYPLVDAGMRELNSTGFMHNRVRMVTASFLTKHLLIDWRWGEAYFAEKLLDYELASNNGGWQWAAGTGCDAAPYFRIFNPTAQAKKFDPQLTYIKMWVPELETLSYPAPMVDHAFARDRCLKAYSSVVRQS